MMGNTESEAPKLTVEDLILCARDHLTRDQIRIVADAFLKYPDRVAIHAKNFWGTGGKSSEEVAQWVLEVAQAVTRGGSA